MIEIQTPGFLSTMLYLNPLHPAMYSEFSQSTDVNETDPGELLVIPSREYLLKNDDDVRNTGFLGTDSLKNSSLAMIREGNGRDLLETYLVSPYFLNEGMGLSETLQMAIGMSSLLHTIREQGNIVRLLQTEKGYAVLPFHENVRELSQAVAVVHY